MTVFTELESLFIRVSSSLERVYTTSMGNESKTLDVCTQHRAVDVKLLR